MSMWKWQEISKRNGDTMYACSVETCSRHEFTIICQQAEFQKYSSMYSTKRSLPFFKGMHPMLIFYGSKLKNPHKGHLFAANIQGGNDFWCNSSEWWDYWMGEGASVQPSIWGHSGFLVPWFDQKPWNGMHEFWVGMGYLDWRWMSQATIFPISWTIQGN